MNLLITGAWNKAVDYIPMLEELGHKICFLQYEKEELLCDYEWVEGVICNGLFLSHSIENFKNLKYIQLTSVGYDRVPMDYINENNIEIHNAKGVYSIPMAEFVLSGVLQIYKQSKFFLNNQKQHQWNKHRGCLELFGKTVCIVGCGNVGTECAKRFNAFGCKVIGVDLFPRNDSNYEVMVVIDKLDQMLAHSDIVVLTLPLTEETKYLFNTGRFEQMKDGAVIVNVARGAVIDTKALIDAMDRLGGAVLDVFEEEPLSEDSELWDMENVIVTPHNSFVGEGNQERLAEVIVRNLNSIY